MDAMATEIAPRIVNPYPNKVIHADIRIQSIDEESKQDGHCSQGNESVVESQPSAEDAVNEKAAEMQANWFAEAIAKNMDLPDGYEKVAVLLIKWADHLDQLRTGEEAEELDALFRERFHYETQIVALNVRKKPQLQLDNHISQFIYEHDGPHSLLIVYYTGHGVYHDNKKSLELTGSINPNQDKGLSIAARATWNKAEEQLRSEDVEGDVLTILDTCYSSNLVKSGREDHKKFELLSACTFDQTTAAPGPNSYTRALIDAIQASLKKDDKRPISTFSLNQNINLDQRRSDTPSGLWNRGRTAYANEQHILLTPLKPAKVEALQQPASRRLPKGYLTLRFGLRDAELNQVQIEFMASTLAKAVSHKELLGIKRIDWLNMEQARSTSDFERVARVIRVIAQWKKVITKNKESQQASQRMIDTVTFPQSMEIDSDRPSPKRAYDDMDDQVPDAKRQHLDTAHPPSPPVSNSSRIE